MREIMISIQPQWVEKILNGEKTIEIRKTMPKCELPCKVYIYCTKGKPLNVFGIKSDGFIFEELNGKVVAEFTFDDVGEFYVFENGSVQGWNWFGLERGCLTYEQISEYIGLNKKGYAWHIDNLKIYDKPKELSEFKKADCDCPFPYVCCPPCNNCDERDIKKPPQSWCYVQRSDL